MTEIQKCNKVLFTGDNVSEFESEVLKLTQATKVGSSIRFADGEASIEVTDQLNNELAIILQSVVSDKALMSLLIMIDALKRYGVKHIIGVVTYFGYARQDRKVNICSPISAKLVAKLLETAGLTRLIAVDLHNELIEGFFDIPVTNLFPTELFVHDIQESYKSLDDVVIVAPDVGAVKRARNLSSHLGKNNIIIIDKYRPEAGISEVMNIIGNVEGKDCIITDDIVDSAGTLCNAAEVLKKQGAKLVDAYITHGVFAGKASDNTIDQAIIKINESELRKVVITNSTNYPIGINMKYCSPVEQTKIVCEKIQVISLSKLIAERMTKYYKDYL